MSSRPSLLSATSCMTAVATKALVMLPIQNLSVGRILRARGDIGEPRGDDGPPAVLLDERDDARELGRRDEPVRVSLQLGLGRWRGSGEGGAREGCTDEGEHAWTRMP